MSNLIYICHIIESEDDGGMARNRAFYNFFLNKNSKIYNMYHSNIMVRLFRLIVFIFQILSYRRKKIFIHIGSIFNIFPKFILRRKFGIFLLKKFIIILAKKNHLIFEINDLPYEQAKDLDLPIENFYEEFQNIIFNNTLKSKYIFASNQMEKYVLEKYSIAPDYSQVLINGAPKLDESLGEMKLMKEYNLFNVKYIYVGTMNKGRGIEELLTLFENRKSYLFLVGPDGEWLLDYLEKLSNIVYLGSYNEQMAMQIASQCDYGILHYDSSKFYYNLCYPTKNSFYIAAGINVISTKLKETQNVLSKYNIFLFEDFQKWESIIENPSCYFNKINNIEENTKEKFYWSTILNNLKI